MNDLIIKQLEPNDSESISTIAEWYFQEWGTPKEYTTNRLSDYPNDITIFQLVAFISGNLIATGGLNKVVSLFRVYPEYKKFEPWIALLHTKESHRNQGIGTKLLRKIESEAAFLQFDKTYLYTNTAKILYIREGWTTIDKVWYNNKDTFIMEKSLNQTL